MTVCSAVGALFPHALVAATLSTHDPDETSPKSDRAGVGMLPESAPFE
jgi:hypothetical protein